MPELPRLKPDPIPAIHPVAEYAASPELLAVYNRTKAGLAVPWMGVVTMAFAHYPTFYERLWTALEPVVGSVAFESACAELRACAENEAAQLGSRNLCAHLRELGYGGRELKDIRDCNEVFSAGNMPYLMIATIARRLLEGCAWQSADPVRAKTTETVQVPHPVLIEPHHADPTTQALYADIRNTLGLPFVNTDYRAFARWPSYFTAAWNGLKPLIASDAYAPALERVHEKALSLAADLPNPSNLTPTDLRAAANADAPEGEVLSVVRLFQWLLPGLAVNVACLRAQLFGG